MSLLLDNGADVSEFITRRNRTRFFRFEEAIGTTLHQAVIMDSAVILNVLLKHAQTHLSKEKLRKLLLALDRKNRSALYLTIEKRIMDERINDAVADLLLEYASSIDSLRPLLFIGFGLSGNALNLCAEGFKYLHVDNIAAYHQMEDRVAILNLKIAKILSNTVNCNPDIAFEKNELYDARGSSS